MFCCCLQNLSETFIVLRRTERGAIKMYIGLHVQRRLFLSDFNETWLSFFLFVKYSNTKFHENPSSGSRVVQWGQTDGRPNREHYEANSSFFSQIGDRAQECATSSVEMYVIQNPVQLHKTAHFPRTFLLKQSAYFRDVARETTVQRRQNNILNSRGKMELTTSYARPDTDL